MHPTRSATLSALALALALAPFVARALPAAEEGKAGKETGPTELQTSLKGDTFSINGQATNLGKKQWQEPEQSWRTVGELIKSALPPADPSGMRPKTTLKIELDEQAPWGATKALFMAASSLGLTKARLVLLGKTPRSVDLKLPGADPQAEEVVELPLSAGAGGSLATENGGKRLPCTPALLKGLVKQLPKATVHVTAANELSAAKVAEILGTLQNEAQAAAVAYLPVKEIGTAEAADRRQAKDAVDRALSGGMGLGQ